MIKNFADQVAVITGAGSGIGRACALAFAREGAAVLVSDLNLERAETVAGEIRAAGGRAAANRCNVAVSADLAAMRQAALDAFGRITILMNNAGVVFSGPFLDVDLAAWRKSFDVNMFAVVEATQMMLPDILAAGGGHIVNVASTAALYPYNADRMSYNSARAGVILFSESLAMDLWEKNVGITCLCPGPTRTNMIQNMTFVGEPSVTAPDLPMMDPEELAEKLVPALREGKFFLPGHDEVYDIVARRGADMDGFLAQAAEKFNAGRKGQ